MTAILETSHYFAKKSQLLYFKWRKNWKRERDQSKIYSSSYLIAGESNKKPYDNLQSSSSKTTFCILKILSIYLNFTQGSLCFYGNVLYNKMLYMKCNNDSG